MVDCKGLKTTNNDYTAVKQSAHSPIGDRAAGVKALPVHARAVVALAPHGGVPVAEGGAAKHAGAGGAFAPHAEAPVAVAPHAVAEEAAATHAGAVRAEDAVAPHAEGAAAGAVHAVPAVANALHAVAAAALAEQAAACVRISDSEHESVSGLVAEEVRLVTGVARSVGLTNDDGVAVCHLRSLLSSRLFCWLGCRLLTSGTMTRQLRASPQACKNLPRGPLSLRSSTPRLS